MREAVGGDPSRQAGGGAATFSCVVVRGSLSWLAVPLAAGATARSTLHGLWRGCEAMQVLL
jgi:hypothetical protein